MRGGKRTLNPTWNKLVLTIMLEWCLLVATCKEVSNVLKNTISKGHPIIDQSQIELNRILVNNSLIFEFTASDLLYLFIKNASVEKQSQKFILNWSSSGWNDQLLNLSVMYRRNSKWASVLRVTCSTNHVTLSNLHLSYTEKINFSLNPFIRETTI